MPGDGGGGGHGGGDEVGAAVFALAAFEIAVAGAGAALAGFELVGVHGEAHAAAGFTPFKTGVFEDAVEAFLLGLALHLAAAGDDRGGGPQVADAGVGAGADEDAVDFYVGERRAGGKAHVFEGAGGGFLLGFVAKGGGVWHFGGDGSDLAGIGAPGNLRRDVGGFEDERFVVLGAGIGGKLTPAGDCFVEFGTLG